MGRGIARAFGGGKASLSPYKGAAPSRSKADWTISSQGPNATVEASLPVLVARHRDLVRNDPHIKRVVSIYVHALVGTGIMATAKHDGTDAGKALAADADRIWEAISRRGVIDAIGVDTMEALQATQAREWMSGNVFVRRVLDRSSPVVPMRIQVLEGDMLDTDKVGTLDNGHRVKQGIETNAIGRIMAYWMRGEHPGESVYGASKSVRVEARDVVHLKLPDRPNQLRGVPITSAVMATKKDLADFEAYTLIQKKTESLVVGVITREPYSEYNLPSDAAPEYDEQGREVEPDVIVPGVVNSDGDLVGSMTPGQWLGVDAGVDVRFNQPQIASNYDTFKRSHLQSAAVGTSVSYEQLSGDFSNANYSTMRGGLLEFWAEIDALLWNYFVPAQDVIWGWVMEAAWLAGLLPTYAVQADWQGPARPSIEPDKDVIADTIKVRNGWKDEDDVIKAEGYHPEKLRRKIQETREERARYGVVSDADPSIYSWRGSMPVQAAAAPLADEPTDSADQSS